MIAGQLTYMRCPDHGFEALGFNYPGGGGIRLTRSKCCGRWVDIKTWNVTPDDLRNIANELQSFADEAECTADLT